MSSFASIRPSLRLAQTTNHAARSFSSSASRSLARVIITGRLAATPELHATMSGQDTIRYSVASSHGPRSNRQTSFFRVTSFLPEGNQRDYITSLPKGTLVYVEGDASLRPYEDSEGRRQFNLNIVQRTLEVLKRPTEASSEHEQSEDLQ